MKNYIYPSYYKTFQCTTVSCPDTCCQGWNIEIDDAIIERWKAMPEQPEDCLLNHINTSPFGKDKVRHTMAMDETQHCSFLNEKGLCRLVLRYGHEMTPKICRDFPRNEVDQENLIQKSVAIRCPAVLDLLWASDQFSYETEGIVDENNYPAKPLLDAFLEYGHKAKDLSSAALLRNLFLALLQTHKKLVADIPVDANGYREYGQELLSNENIQMVKDALSKIGQVDHGAKGKAAEAGYAANHQVNPLEELGMFLRASSQNYSKKPDPEPEPELRICHDLMYELMREFFDSKVFGKDFRQLFYQSQDMLRLSEETQWRLFEEAKPDAETDRKLKLIVLEELLNSVLTIEVMDYETILVRLQWLIVQYLTIRYILYLDVQEKKEATDAGVDTGKSSANAGQDSENLSDAENVYGETEELALLRHRMLFIFRVSDLPDIIKISFFDTKFSNWMWKENSPEIELLKH